ncbi:MAG: hypothetical protein EXS37_11710 [Opitutus sp.]|nr:hypothetical protein [Opitutus sp.]
MKVTLNIPDSEMEDVCSFTGETKKGRAILKMVSDALRLKRREKLAQKFINGEWSAGLAGIKSARAADRNSAKQRARTW